MTAEWTLWCPIHGGRGHDAAEVLDGPVAASELPVSSEMGFALIMERILSPWLSVL